MTLRSPRSSSLTLGLTALSLAAGFVAGGMALGLPDLFAGPTDAVPSQVIDTTGSSPVVSADGRRVAYVAPSAVMGDDAGAPDSVWLLDRSTGTRTVLTTPIDGTRPGASVQPVLSGDGCTVVVVTENAYDQFRDDDHGDRWDVYRTVLPGCAGAFEPGEWELVSSTSGPDPFAIDLVDPSARPAVNDSGELVVYTRRLAAGDGVVSTWTALDLVDLTVTMGEPGRVLAVPGLPAAGPSVSGTFVGQRDPAVSSDGRYVAYVTDALPTVTEDDTGAAVVTGAWTEQVVDGAAVTQVVRWDRRPSDDADGAWFQVVSVGPSGAPGNGSSRTPALGAAGEVVAFSSVATDLVAPPVPAEGESVTPPAAGPPVEQVYRSVRDGFTRRIEPVSAVDGRPGNGASRRPALDETGRLVAFQTAATDLVAPAPTQHAVAEAGDILVADTDTGSFRRLTTRPDGQAASFGSRSPSVSATARVIVYDTAVAGELGLPVPPPDPAAAPELDPVTGAPVLPWHVVVAEFPAELSSADLDLGTVDVGGPSEEWFTTIVNHGDSAFVPEIITTSNPEFTVAGGTCQARVAVLPQESCTVEVVFTPSIAGPASADVVVAERGFEAAAVSVAVSANAGTPSIVASPSANQLADALVGLVGAPTTITVTNYGVSPTTVNSVALAGSHPGDFQVLADECTGHVIEVAASCQAVVALAPTESGARSATLTAYAADGGTASAVLVGTGSYTPVVGIRQATVAAGGRVDVVGLGFPADTFVSVGFDGDRETLLVLTDGRGELRSRVVVPRTLGAGRVSLLVVDPLGRHQPIRSDEVLVTARAGGGGNSPAHRAS